MRRGPVLRWLWLASLAFSSGAFARTEEPLTYRAIRAMPPAVVGLRLLGPEGGDDIVRTEFIDVSADARRLPSALQLFLYARPVPIGSNYCSQRRSHRLLTNAVSGELRSLRHGEPLRVVSGWEETTLARAPGCRLAAGQRFASIREADIAMRALDDLAALQMAARAQGPMASLQLTCRDEVEDDPDRCAAGTREVLARLPLDHACLVDRASDDQPNIDVYLCTGATEWLLHLLIAGSSPPRLSVVWKYPNGGY